MSCTPFTFVSSVLLLSVSLLCESSKAQGGTNPEPNYIKRWSSDEWSVLEEVFPKEFQDGESQVCFFRIQAGQYWERQCFVDDGKQSSDGLQESESNCNIFGDSCDSKIAWDYVIDSTGGYSYGDAEDSYWKVDPIDGAFVAMFELKAEHQFNPPNDGVPRQPKVNESYIVYAATKARVPELGPTPSTASVFHYDYYAISSSLTGKRLVHPKNVGADGDAELAGFKITEDPFGLPAHDDYSGVSSVSLDGDKASSNTPWTYTAKYDINVLHKIRSQFMADTRLSEAWFNPPLTEAWCKRNCAVFFIAELGHDSEE